MRKSKTIRVRITENQLKRLTNVLIEEELNKSELIREIIDKYVRRSCRNPQKKDVVQEITKINGRNTINTKNIN
jgi:metal-responsive CopG/Arc/MetJ family transcriptional regulator